MLRFESHEFVETDRGIELTGEVESFEANSIGHAVDCFIKSKKIDGYNIKIGPTGRCIYIGNYGYAIVTVKG